MNTLVEQMVREYQAQTINEQKNAIKEVMQEIILCGLSRAGLFRTAAFYGGTALRIFYGLDRFSEDLDFSLTEADEKFDLKEYFPILKKELNAYALNVTIDEKEKAADSNIRSAFLKGNTKEHLLMFYPDENNFPGVPKNEIIKIKFEIDVNPPAYATFEHRYRLQPVPYEVRLYDGPSLFAGKLHAVLGRSWKNRIKGRDLYDYVFYLSRKIPVNRRHLQARLIQSGHIQTETNFELPDVKRMLCERFETIDYQQAKSDVTPFIKTPGVLDLWNADFFKQITNDLTEV